MAHAILAAATARQLAVLLKAGIAPTRAWKYLADSDTGGREFGRVAQAISWGEHGAKQIASLAGVEDVSRRRRGRFRVPRQPATTLHPTDDGVAWAVLAAAWQVAMTAGAPLALTLERVAAMLEGFEVAANDAAVAAAGPRLAARVVSWLPVAGLLLTAGSGTSGLWEIFVSLFGIAALFLGAALIVVGSLWSRHIVAVAARRDPAPGLLLELTALALAGGGSLPRAQELASVALNTCLPVGLRALEWRRADEHALAGIRSLASVTGASVRLLLEGEAAACRRRGAVVTATANARLSVKLLLPLGCCALPAFLLLGVVPTMLALISSTVHSL